MGGNAGTASAFQGGLSRGESWKDERRERREALEDEERRTRVTDLYSQGHSLALQIPSLTGADRDKALGQLADVEESIRQIYHPVKNPGVLQRDWDHLVGLVTRKPRPTAVTTTTAPDLTLAAGTTSMPAPAGMAGPRLSPIRVATEPLTLPGGQSVTVRGPITPEQQRQQMQNRDAARKSAELDVAAAGLSPEQEVEAASRKNLAYITQARKDYRAANPDATPAQEAAFMSDLISKTYGITQKPVWKEFVGPDGQKDWLDVTQPVPPGWTATGTESADTRKRADYAEYKRQHPEYTGTFEQWSAEQPLLARQKVPVQQDQRYIAIQQKQKLGQPLTDDDKAFLAAYDMYINKRVLGPIAARAGDRYVQVMNPANPEQVIFMTAHDASASGAGTPQSIAFKVDEGMRKFMTSGKGGQNMIFFNTAVEHLKLLQEAADALNNGDLRTANYLGNFIGMQFGDSAPTNFAAIKSAVAGELAKTFTGVGATIPEIAEISGVISSSDSPEQISGAISFYLRSMEGRVNALNQQAAGAYMQPPAASTGGGTPSPVGGGTTPPPPTATSTGGPRKYKGMGSKGPMIFTVQPGDVAEFLRDHPEAKEVK